MQQAPQLMHFPFRSDETGSRAVTVLFSLADQVFLFLMPAVITTLQLILKPDISTDIPVLFNYDIYPILIMT